MTSGSELKARREQTRRSWNLATEAHNAHKRDQAAFLRGGGTTLFSDEIELLGELAGKSLLHLQCNAGQDSLCLARLGAEVTGVDISDAAIDFARRLSQEAGIPARFERADVLDWLPGAATDERRFDVVFASYGALPWIDDIAAWMRGVAAVLAPGGRLVVMEFHPLIWSVDQDLRIKDPYFAAEVFSEPVGDYVGRSGDALAPSGFVESEPFENPELAHSYQWTVAQILQALLDSGLRLREVREYPYINGCKFLPNLRELPGKRFTLPHGTASLPMQLGLVAES
ncbi:MAG: methyltransferase domain-containing protein [Polyangiaceae bacterium]